jgi:hypothetical protein
MLHTGIKYQNEIIILIYTKPFLCVKTITFTLRVTVFCDEKAPLVYAYRYLERNVRPPTSAYNIETSVSMSKLHGASFHKTPQ